MQGFPFMPFPYFALAMAVGLYGLCTVPRGTKVHRASVLLGLTYGFFASFLLGLPFIR